MSKIQFKTSLYIAAGASPLNGLFLLKGLTQCFSHAPGHMFICDVTTAEFQNSHPFPYKQCIPCVVRICENRKRFSVVSKSVKDKICCLEQLLLYDIGERGVENLSVKGDLLKSLLVLYKASSVGITFGFPIFGDKPVAEETDGMPGAIAIAKTLCALGKHVSLIVDKRNEVMLKKIIQQCLGLKIFKRDIPVLVYDRQVDREVAAKHFLYPNGSEMSARFDHLVSIERTGPNRNGQYCSMKGLSLKDDLIAPVEDLFKLAAKDDNISTTCIGDGGNELGMGKVEAKVEEHIEHGKEIACVVSCDYLITAGVSNWGGYALAVGLYVLSMCPIHVRYVQRGLENVKKEERCKGDFVSTVEEEAEVLNMLVNEGVRDGRSGEPVLSVDGFQFYPYHADMIKKFQDVIDM